MNDETFASLMEMGFTSTDCKLASEFGCVTLEEAVNHLTNPVFVNNINLQAPVLTLNKNSTEQLRTTASNENDDSGGFLIHSRCSVSREAQKLIADKNLANLKEETIKMKQLKRIEHEAIRKEVQADKRARQELQGHSSTKETIRDNTVGECDDSFVRSRYARNIEEETKWNQKMQQKAKDEMQREQKLKDDARRKVLLDIEQDRLNRAQKGPPNSEIRSERATGSEQIGQTSSMNVSDFVTFRFRFPDGGRVEEKFKLNSRFSVVAHFVASQLESEVGDFSIAESFPPFKCYNVGDHEKSLQELNFRGAVSLVVKRSIKEQPMQMDEAEPMVVTTAVNDQSSSSEGENEEIPYAPLVEEHAAPGDNIQEPMGEIEDVDIDQDRDIGNFPDNMGEEDAEDDDLPPAGRVPRAGIAFNIAQRLGGQDSSDPTLGNEEQTLSVDALRQQRCQALFNRFSANEQNSCSQIEGLRYSCGSLSNLASENVLNYFLQQKLFLSNLDFVSAKCLIEMLKAKNLLTSKTFRPFIQSCFELDLSSYRLLTNDLINAISLSNVILKLNLKSGENLTDAALDKICEMQQLQLLDISFCSNFTSNKICKLIEKLPNLEILKAAGTKISTASMEATFWHTESFPKILVLDLSDTFVSDISNFQIWFPNVHNLSLNGIDFTEFHDIASSLGALRELHLANCTIPIQGLLGIAKLVDLESLDLTNAVLADTNSEIYTEFLLSLLSLKKLLNFKPPRDPSLENTELDLIGKLNLAEIDLSNCTRISNAGFEKYMEASYNLKEPKISILLASNTHFSFRATTFLSSLKNLIELNLDYTEIGENGVQNIQSLPLLSSLSLVGNGLSDKIFTDANSNSPGESNLFTTLTSLTKLNLSRNGNISNFGLKRLRVSTLETLAVVHTKVTTAVEDVLKTNMPHLRVIRF